MMDAALQEKWDRIYATDQHGSFPPCKLLQMQSHLLPRNGVALDLACGLGRNAIHLCRHGLTTHAWDISNQAILKLNEYLQHEGLSITTEVRDVCANPPGKNRFDVITVSHFLDRSLMPALIGALKENGLLFYQTFTRLKISDTGPTNPDYLLERHELLKTFSEQDIVFYCDNGDIGDTQQGLRNEAMIVVRKKRNIAQGL
ncbi:MAG: methyltransferase domain-containing protein [Thiotrichales bacterium]|nr:methyltransferase domain-containing protein [Thiotrichales bacterium]